ncbi:MAG TPA: prepilin-type N-terminal cleavage/methylation domain-containing protein [bacterium]|nr:prepilin-type N-terminal cleavage/methylation domain-containing protein [bacterium]HQO33330.1 prepilin-type N-terminal cleavage/methylation domain-containing protein [bacterium]HQP99910.1 prepilin-type N-terminal cleavage/methylation domain-containing protein [bacterium]
MTKKHADEMTCPLQRIQSKGFTLIELLIVVAIIGILAAIAVPNFMNARIRAKISRAHADMRAISTAIQQFQLERNTMPLDFWTDNSDFAIERWETKFHRVGPMPPATTLEAPYYPLTSPVSYLTGLPKDPFGMPGVDIGLSERGEAYLYCAHDPDAPGQSMATVPPLARGQHIMMSLGPDRYFGLISEWPRRATPYDPTNGLISEGQIMRRSDGGLALDPNSKP